MPTPKPTKTIAQVLEEFLADRKLRWSPKTCARYADIIIGTVHQFTNNKVTPMRIRTATPKPITA
jgi:hypothetical protein